MNRFDKNGVVYYAFEHIENTGLARHGLSTRLGGVSTGCCQSMNLGFARDDERENVVENFHLITAAIGVSSEHLVFSRQVHGDMIQRVGEEEWGRGFTRDGGEAVDGLVTASPSTVLTTFYADCVPLLFLDPVRKVIASAHAGWRGTVMNIGSKTVRSMSAEFGCRPTDILAGIGPSIGPDSFEVGGEVCSEFLKNLPFSQPFIRSNPAKPGKFFIDLWGVNSVALANAGILSDNIEVAGIDTVTSDEFYSHRRDDERRGSMAAFISLG